MARWCSRLSTGDSVVVNAYLSAYTAGLLAWADHDGDRKVEELIEESIPKQKQNPLAFLAPEVFWIYYLGTLLYWLYDTSEDKQNTLAFLDRSLTIGVALLRKGKP